MLIRLPADRSPRGIVDGRPVDEANPAFTVTFAPRLVIGEQYSVKLYMDVNASGACESPPTDHQWSVPIPADFSSHQETVTYTHNTSFTEVCSYFP